MSRKSPGAYRRAGTLTKVVLLSMLLPFSVASDEGENARTEAWKKVFRSSTAVDVVEVDVRVHDRDGTAVRGLGAEDFVVEVDGEAVPIVNFFEASGSTGPEVVAGDPAAGAVPETSPADAGGADLPWLVVYVDNANMGSRERDRLLQPVRDFLGGDDVPVRALIVSNDRQMAVRQQATRSSSELLTALAELPVAGSVRQGMEMERRELLRTLEQVDVEVGAGIFDTKAAAIGDGSYTADDDSGGTVEAAIRKQNRLTQRAAAQAEQVLMRLRAHTQELTMRTEATFVVLRSLVEAVAGLPGQKTVLVLSDGLSTRPGAGLYDAFTRRFQALADVGSGLSAAAESAREDLTPQLDEIVALASERDIIISVLDASAERREQGSASTTGESGGWFANWNDSLESLEIASARDGLAMLAEGTGGRLASSPTAWVTLMEELPSEWRDFYSIGIPAGSLAGDRSHRVEVRVRDGKRLDVRHRRRVRQRSAEERAVEATRAALLREDAENPMGIGVAADLPQAADDGTWVVSVMVRVPISRLVLLPGPTDHAGRVSLYVASRDPEGRTSGVAEHLCPVRIPNEDMLTTLGQSAVCGVRLRMREGPQRVAVSILDGIAEVQSTSVLDFVVGAGDPQAPAH